MTPLISIIVPVYNTAVFLPRCLDSLLAQTYQNIEIILVDDGSSDGSGVLCDKYARENRSVKSIHQANAGISAARNKGILAAAGEYIGFVDSDDYCTLDMYETLFNLMEKYQAKAAAANYYSVTNQGITSVPIALHDRFLTGEDAICSCVEHLGSFACNKLFTKELFTGLTFITGRYFEDFFICYQLYDKAGGVAVTGRPVYYYNRSNTASVTKSAFSVKKLDYFIASSCFIDFCHRKGYYLAEKKAVQARAWHLAGFLRQIAHASFKDQAVIFPLVQELRHLIYLHLVGPHKISNKLFALACCVNFNCAAFIYRWIYLCKEEK